MNDDEDIPTIRTSEERYSYVKKTEKSLKYKAKMKNGSDISIEENVLNKDMP
jgi:hypothetical protein